MAIGWCRGGADDAGRSKGGSGREGCCWIGEKEEEWWGREVENELQPSGFCWMVENFECCDPL